MIVQRLFDAAQERDLTFRKYSGRNMYGRFCPAIVGSETECRLLVAAMIIALVDELAEASLMCDDTEEQRLIAFNLKDQFDDMMDKVLLWKIDDIGLDIVMYWPDIEWKTPEETGEGVTLS